MTLSTKPAPFGKKCRAYGVGPECRRDREANHNPCPASDDDRSGRLLVASVLRPITPNIRKLLNLRKKPLH